MGKYTLWVVRWVRSLLSMSACVCNSVAFPESPRWLAVQGRYDEVSKLLQRMCETNGRQLPPDFDPKWLIDEVIVDGTVSAENNCCIFDHFLRPK